MLVAMLGAGRALPMYVRREFDDYLECRRLEHGFLRVRCEGYHTERLLAFNRKRPGGWSSRGARRMMGSADDFSRLLRKDPFRVCADILSVR